jgi:hypothetical protein
MIVCSLIHLQASNFCPSGSVQYAIGITTPLCVSSENFPFLLVQYRAAGESECVVGYIVPDTDPVELDGVDHGILQLTIKNDTSTRRIYFSIRITEKNKYR